MAKEDWSVPLGLIILDGKEIGPGLSEHELAAIEDYWAFRFPPDLREMLQVALPLMPPFPDWRGYRTSQVCDLMEWPVDGICYDVEHDDFWLDAWGRRPLALEDAITVAKANLKLAPKLIPIYGHRYLPAEPCESGNPVFSVYQTDVIYYGANLRDYILTEFGDLSWEQAVAKVSKRIPFWADLADS